MDTNFELSFAMAARLKQLREEAGLSHIKLSEQLADSLGVNISKDSLIKYEVADVHHTAKLKNLGMRVEFLHALATFYNVSADYLLGLTTVKTPSADMQAIVKQTGLSEENVRYLTNPEGNLGNIKTDPASLMVVHSLVNDLISFCRSSMLDLDHVQMMLMLSAQKEYDNEYASNTTVSYGDAEATIKHFGMTTIPALDGAKFYAREIGNTIARCFIAKYIDSNSSNQ